MGSAPVPWFAWRHFRRGNVRFCRVGFRGLGLGLTRTDRRESEGLPINDRTFSIGALSLFASHRARQCSAATRRGHAACSVIGRKLMPLPSPGLHGLRFAVVSRAPEAPLGCGDRAPSPNARRSAYASPWASGLSRSESRAPSRAGGESSQPGARPCRRPVHADSDRLFGCSAGTQRFARHAARPHAARNRSRGSATRAVYRPGCRGSSPRAPHSALTPIPHR